MGVDYTAQTLTTQVNLARMAPSQLVGLIEKQAGDSVTSSPSEEKIGARKSLHLVVCALVVKGQNILLRT